MKIFLSSRYSRRDELREVRRVLHSMGYDVISRWLDTNWEEKDDLGSSAAPAGYREQYAISDIEDVRECDILIAFTEVPRSNTRGGRHVELGVALALEKRVIVVGPAEHIFHYHPSVSMVRDEPGYLTMVLGLLGPLRNSR